MTDAEVFGGLPLPVGDIMAACTHFSTNASKVLGIRCRTVELYLDAVELRIRAYRDTNAEHCSLCTSRGQSGGNNNSDRFL
jgi:hypothetical protein